MHSPSSPPKPTRRLPPPCWSDQETAALIHSYRHKWYSLKRGNLRAPDWQDVADAVAARCPFNIPPKTSLQCRHKMEKLRKRYRSEIQRIGNVPNSLRKPYGYVSSWVHFKLMDDMESGLSSVNSPNDVVLQSNNNNNNKDDKIGVRIKIPGYVVPCAKKRNGVLLDDLPPEYGSGMDMDTGTIGMRKGDVMSEMVGAIERLGEGFVRIERRKMEMAKEMEEIRMKGEMRQTEMVIEMHRKMWEAYAETVLERRRRKKKKVRRVEAIEG